MKKLVYFPISPKKGKILRVEVCPECLGTKRIEVNKGYYIEEYPCRACYSEGYIETEEKKIIKRRL